MALVQQLSVITLCVACLICDVTSQFPGYPKRQKTLLKFGKRYGPSYPLQPPRPYVQPSTDFMSSYETGGYPTKYSNYPNVGTLARYVYIPVPIVGRKRRSLPDVTPENAKISPPEENETNDDVSLDKRRRPSYQMFGKRRRPSFQVFGKRGDSIDYTSFSDKEMEIMALLVMDWLNKEEKEE